jgi:hypothetical protein
MGRLDDRLSKLESQMGASDKYFAGYIEVPVGARPIDCLRDAGPGYWLMVDRYDTMQGLVGHVSRSGKREILFGGGGA